MTRSRQSVTAPVIMLQRFVRIGLSSNARCMAYSAQAMRKAPGKVMSLNKMVLRFHMNVISVQSCFYLSGVMQGVAPGLTDIVDETTR